MTSQPEPPPIRHGPHPAVSLVVGFGLICLGAALVHIVFNVML